METRTMEGGRRVRRRAIPDDEPLPKLMTIPEIAEALGIKRQGVGKAVREGRLLPAVEVEYAGRVMRQFRAEDVRAYSQTPRIKEIRPRKPKRRRNT